MKYLVTGGAGFIGSHITERILNEGHLAVVLDNFVTGRESNLDFVKDIKPAPGAYRLIKGSITDYNVCLDACKGVDVVFHEAALKSVPKSMKDPYSFNDVNINGMLTLLRACKECGVKRVVFASSSSVYGKTDKFPQQEDAYPLLISPYALTKLAGEYYMRIFSENYGLETVAIRYFNVFGPRQALDDEYSAVIPKFISCVKKGENPPVFGDGKQSRDFTYVKNVVDANLLAANVKGVKCEVMNVACGQEVNLLYIVDCLNKILNKNVVPSFLPKRAGDLYRSFADISRAKKILSYKPGVTFEEGLKKTVEWFNV